MLLLAGLQPAPLCTRPRPGWVRLKPPFQRASARLLPRLQPPTTFPCTIRTREGPSGNLRTSRFTGHPVRVFPCPHFPSSPALVNQKKACDSVHCWIYSFYVLRRLTAIEYGMPVGPRRSCTYTRGALRVGERSVGNISNKRGVQRGVASEGVLCVRQRCLPAFGARVRSTRSSPGRRKDRRQ